MFQWEREEMCVPKCVFPFAGLSRPAGVAFPPIHMTLYSTDNDGFVTFAVYGYAWHFFLNLKFSLNMTFHYVYFSAAMNDKCALGNLKITQFLGEIKMCGILSKTSVYAPVQRPAIGVQMEFDVLHDVKMSYSVIDSGPLLTLPPTCAHLHRAYIEQHSTAVVSALWPVRFLQHHLQLQMYKLVASKLEVIHLKVGVAENISVVHDGPSSLSQPIRAKPHKSIKVNTYVTTSFQCLMLLYNYTSHLKFSFHLWTETDTQHVKLQPHNSKVMTYPDQQFCPVCSFSFVQIKTQHGFYLNLSVINMTVSGENNTMTCSFAGLAAYHRQREITSMCPTSIYNYDILKFSDYSDTEPGVFQPVYSENSSMTLVWYSYQPYTRMRTTFQMSTTACKAARINICESGIGDTGFPTQKGHCFIMQLFQGFGDQGKDRYCSITTKMNTMTEEFNARGFFRSKSVLNLEVSFSLHTSEFVHCQTNRFDRCRRRKIWLRQCVVSEYYIYVLQAKRIIYTSWQTQRDSVTV